MHLRHSCSIWFAAAGRTNAGQLVCKNSHSHARAAKQQSAVALAVCHGPGNAMTVDRILTVLVAVAAKILVWDLALIQVSLNFLFEFIATMI